MCGYLPVCFLSGNFAVNMIISRGVRLCCICTCRRGAEAHAFWRRSTAVAAATFLHLVPDEDEEKLLQKAHLGLQNFQCHFHFFAFPSSPALVVSLPHTCLMFPPKIFWVTLQTRARLEVKPCISFQFTLRNIMTHFLLSNSVCLCVPFTDLQLSFLSIKAGITFWAEDLWSLRVWAVDNFFLMGESYLRCWAQMLPFQLVALSQLAVSYGQLLYKLHHFLWDGSCVLITFFSSGAAANSVFLLCWITPLASVRLVCWLRYPWKTWGHWQHLNFGGGCY